ncbi:hypothetical protein AAGG49_23185, partial [Stenotrophomonas maltophilia]|uniref:hypothetical protein n=1 Tax=Stenotrophomonas maltophilia TaxID=40324 RepID=UPI00313C9BCB
LAALNYLIIILVLILSVGGGGRLVLRFWVGVLVVAGVVGGSSYAWGCGRGGYFVGVWFPVLGFAKLCFGLGSGVVGGGRPTLLVCGGLFVFCFCLCFFFWFVVSRAPP